MSTAPIQSLPPDLVEYIAQLDAADVRASDAIRAITDVQANWQPHHGAGWSIVQCLDHLAATNTQYLTAMKTAAPRARPGHRPFAAAGWFSRTFIRKIGTEQDAKFKAPKKIRPAPQAAKAVALANFLAAERGVRQFVVDTASVDLCSVRFRNPFIPGIRFTIASALLAIAAHNFRHLQQIDRILRDPLFPA